MLARDLTLSLLFAILAVFVGIGMRAGRRYRRAGTDDFTIARGSQGAASLWLSFLASGLGAWILFAPPELGALLGIVPVIGYAVAAAGPFVVFAFVGPRLRRIVPSGHGLNEFVRVRYGPAASVAVSTVSVLYMGVFLAAELVAIGGLVELLGSIPRHVTITVVVVATLAYTVYGGLPSSLHTDRWQSWLVIVLLVGAAIAAVSIAEAPVATMRAGGSLAPSGPGLQSAATLVLAVTAANMFHHGYWQRVWSARDDRALRAGALIAAAATVPLILAAGGFGVLARSLDLVEVPALSLFALMAELPTAVTVGILVLGIALVTSSLDTLENGLAALIIAERPRLRLRDARLLTVIIVLPAAALGLVATSVLQLFLIADLLAAILLLPTLLGMWQRTTTIAVWAGVIAGALGALGMSYLATHTLAGALAAVTFADAIPTLPPFAGALLASGLATVVVSTRGRRRTDLTDLEALVQARTRT